MLRDVDAPQITISFPGAPEFLRLARLTSADAGSRAGFDYEDVDDLRIAVSELCSLLGGSADSAVTLEFDVAPGRVGVRGRAAPGNLVDSELSRTIVDAVVDEVRLKAEDGVAWFECTKRVNSAEGGR
jgi:serine/threonine-protein kinase RsbW